MILASQHIDHTNLKPNATTDDIRKLCEEAKKYDFRGVCVHPCHVNSAFRHLAGSDIKLVTVIGFPLGANDTDVKVFETEQAINDGADEVDVVWNIGAFKAKEYLKTTLQLDKIIKRAKESSNIFVKIIVEICYLDIDELEKAYQVVLDSGADCIKTSTGFGPKTMDNWYAVSIWNAIRGSNLWSGNLKIKASSGIRTCADAQRVIDSGADILGTSSGVKIMEERRQIIGTQSRGKGENCRCNCKKKKQ